MLQGRQTDRLIAKVMRLGVVYEPLMKTSEVFQTVFISEGGITSPAKKGLTWGKDFSYADFYFEAQGLKKGESYYLSAETGGVEHLVSVNGKKVGLIDKVEGERDGVFRIHGLLLLDNLKNGDKVNVEAYYSHSLPGTMPYDEVSTFALKSYAPVRPYKRVTLVTIWQNLAKFSQKLTLLNKHYLSREDNTFEKVAVEKVYARLFEILPMEPSRLSDEALYKAVEVIDEYFKNCAKYKPFVGVIGHSHLDTAWLWTVEETRHKLMRTLSNAVTLLEKYPDYKFFLSTVLYLKWVEEDDPDLFVKVKELIKKGRIEPNGSTWVECDGNLTGAEAFCRQFIRGKRYLRDKFDYESDTFWLPDTFGYSAALPQIMKKSGVKYFCTTKLGWNDTNTFPYETFVWQGNDGSAVITHFNSIQTAIDDKSVSDRLSNVRDKRESDCVLMAYGYGDGGGGPSSDMVEQALYTQQNCAFADVKHVTVSDFMSRLDKKELPTYCGELYLELHRGTFTTNHALKKNNRRLEEALHNAELVSVFKEEDNKAVTDGLYDILMLNQFHDILPGTCIKEATDIAISEQRAAIEKALEIIRGKGSDEAYFNTLWFSRDVLLDGKKGTAYIDLDGNERRLSLYRFKPYGYGTEISASGEVFFDGKTVTTPYYTATLTDGEISSFIYNGRELVNGRFAYLAISEDVPYIYDNWDIDADYVLKERAVKFIKQNVVLQTKNLLIIRASFKLTEKSALTRDIIFRSDCATVEFDNKLEFYDKHTLLRTYFDTTLFARHYNCETQFGYVERNALPQSREDNAKFEVCSHKWTDLSERNVGLSLLSDSKYGVSVIGGKMGLTLHKSGTHPDARGDNGVSRFRYALYPHEKGLGTDTVKEGYSFNMLPVLTSIQTLECPFVVKGDDSVIVETIKQGENGGIALRLYESMGATAKISVSSDKYKSITLTNILEDSVSELSKNGEAVIVLSPFEIVTLVLR